ncbi:unnamed protein product [Orchesella dallaii]|uniref:Histidine decarboxylase n=1 Tax=Orchesella dallaii TaxID=48710 RepID=A0ABP1RNA4_9HEXA
MDVEEYRQRGKEMVDFIADYLTGIRARRVFPAVKPGYMKPLIPDEAPQEGESYQDIFEDFQRIILPGVTHWQSPHMHAYFPALNSYPSLLGDMLADAINCLGFTWASSPACTELETIVMDWLGKMVGLPSAFLHSSKESLGGGVIQTTASESTFIALMAGRSEAIRRCKTQYPELSSSEINARLVAYCSDQAHSSVEKAGLIGLVRMHYLDSDDESYSIDGEALSFSIQKDRENGLIPFWVCATLGTTGSCAFDNLEELGNVCRQENLWLHVDAAYAGSAFICPEFRGWMKGVENANSFAFNPSKWLMVHFDCTAMWVQDAGALHRTFNVDPLYLQHENSGMAIDYMHWQIALSKRFRALKLWFVLRSFGVQGLQEHIRKGVRLAARFEAMVAADSRFEISAKRHLGLVVFRLRGDNELTETLLKRLNASGKIHCVPASLKGRYVIRFTITSPQTTVEDICTDWAVVKETARAVLANEEVRDIPMAPARKVPLAETRLRNAHFGTSLLLANSPMSPKIVNGSFAAIFDSNELFKEFERKLKLSEMDNSSPAVVRRRIKGMIMAGKQYSLDSRMDIVSTMHSNNKESVEEDDKGRDKINSVS